jgi:hypothetical protein
MKNSIVIILSLLLLFLPYINNKKKFNLYILTSDNIFSQLLSINLILFSLLENTVIGLLLMLIFIQLQITNKKNLKEGFVSYYK